MDDQTTTTKPAGSRWRGPTIPDIARAAGVGTATVDRVLNERGRVREATRRKVLDALAELGDAAGQPARSEQWRVAVLNESGSSFNGSMQQAVEDYAARHPDIAFSFSATRTAEFQAPDFVDVIERAAREADGLIVVAREDLAVNRAIRTVMARGVPVVCVTTDLPSSHRLAYVGSDQTAAGGTAAYLMGRVVGARSGNILLVFSAPYRAQEERELGFRRVLRSEFTHLRVEERVSSNDDIDFSYRNVRKYIQEHGAPVGIYNVAAGNLGIARALRDEGLTGQVAFIGHELNTNSRMALEGGEMDFVIGHDVDREVALSVEVLAAALGRGAAPRTTQTKVRIYTKYNCD